MLTFTIEPDETQWHAFCAELPGCHTWGATREEAMRHLKDAVNLYLEDEIESQDISHLTQSTGTYA